MLVQRRGLWGILSVVLIFVFGGTSYAKSVYAVAGHTNGKIKAYLIVPNGTIYRQATIPHPMPDATGLCLWPSKDKMFVTYETVDTISWASIKNLDRNPATDDYDTGITGGNGLGGMVVDEQISLLYVLSRGTDRLYAFDYDEYENTLVPVALGQTTDYVELENIDTAIDIAIDEEGSSVMGVPVGRLYVSDLSETVRYYNAATWEYENYIEFLHPTVGIGLDKTRGYLYAGYFPGPWPYPTENYLMRYTIGGDPDDLETYLEKNMDYSVMDIAVDEDTGYIYLTTYWEDIGAVEVYDPTNWNSSDPDSLVLLDIENDSDFGGESNGPGGIAVGPNYKPEGLNVWKQDDVTGDVGPGELITYDIRCSPTDANEYNVVVTDKLPEGVDFDSADPDTGYYTPRPVHSYTWEIGFMQWADPNKPTAPTDPNVYLELTVQVNDRAEPAGYVINEVKAESDDSYALRVRKTEVRCWGGDIIFVDVFATGYKTGVDWENAYTDLQDALLRAGENCGKKIWVAEGIYSPGDDTVNSFIIPDGVEVYGGFNGDEDPNTFDVADRDYTAYGTILTGYNETTRNRQVVTMGDETILDGFVVKNGDLQGIYGEDVDFSILNCVIENNTEIGINCKNGNVHISWCVIKENGYDGIWHVGSGTSLLIENCKIHDNIKNGVYFDYSTGTIINSMVYRNGLGGAGYYGIKFYQPSNNPAIRNNTIVHNSNEGIRFTGSNTPDIRNCIIWYNNEDGGLTQLLGYDTTYYCCVTDPNDLVGSSTQAEPYYNITCNPDFAYGYGEYGYYHLDPGSHCVDTGDDTYVGAGEEDIDGDDRIYGSDVDIGADEVACDDVSSERDFNNGDGLVGTDDFTVFSAAWLTHDPDDPLTDPNHPDYVEDPNAPGYIDPDSLVANWDSRCDLDTDLDVDLADFGIFMDDWLWEACWRSSSEGTWMMMMGMGGGDMGRMMDIQTLAIADLRLAELAALRESEPAPEPTIEEQLDNAKQIVKWLEEIWLDEELQKTVGEEQWKEFMDNVYKWLYELEAIYNDKSSE